MSKLPELLMFFVGIYSGAMYERYVWSEKEKIIAQQELNVKISSLESSWSAYADSLQALSSAEEKMNLHCHSPEDKSDLCTTTRDSYEHLKYKAFEEANKLKAVSSSPDLVDRLMNEYQ